MSSSAPTWKEAFEKTLAYCEEEIQKLVAALRTREQALTDAEEKEENAM